MGLRSELTSEVGDIFTEISAELEGEQTLTLLRAADDYDEFAELLSLNGKWFFEYSNFRRNFLLEIADESEELTRAIKAATHVRIGNEYYAIAEGDPTPPNMTDATWKIYCDRYERAGQYRDV
jgi:hypothetical protein